MSLNGKRVLLTGASGGIGKHVARELARRGAQMALIGRDESRLAPIAEDARSAGAHVVTLAFDLGSATGHDDVVGRAAAALGGIDVLVNNAGLQSFSSFAVEEPGAVTRLIAVNFTAPILLTHAALRRFDPARGGQLVYIGSTFGAIGFPNFATYSATKFGLRGFAEALRRELAERNVSVTYVSPRATNTDMNSAAVRELQARTKTAVDDPLMVARQVVTAIEDKAPERQLGWPERFFVRLNAVLPRLVDKSLIAQARTAAQYLRR